MIENEIKPIKIMIVAGEDSGDQHAAALVKSLNKGFGARGVEFFGATGERMRAAGVKTIVRSDSFGIVGVPEVLRAVPMFLGVMNRLTRSAVEEKTDLAILVDFPEFNLKLAKRLKKRGIKVVYYISPQLWAWRSYRIRTIRKHVDLLITILPFEEDWYKSRGVNHTVYAGHPLAGRVKPTVSREEFRKENGIAEEARLVALLPGSRGKEIERNFPVMIEAAKRFLVEQPDSRFAVVLARSRNNSEIGKYLINEPAAFCRSIFVVEADFYNVLNASDAAAVTSGTATLETALIGTPQVIVYRTSALNYRLLKPFINIEQYGLANLIAGRQVFNELIQTEFTAEALFLELNRLTDPDANNKLREAAAKIRQTVGDKNAADAAAAEIIRISGF